MPPLKGRADEVPGKRSVTFVSLVVADSSSLSQSPLPDSGESFLPRVRVSDRVSSSRIGSGVEHGLADLGSRIALVSTDSRAYGVWTDTHGGSRQTAKQDIARGVVAFNDPPRLS